jgi:crotonobetainyl-CoA:carnitine CoA-transferase CaiB-like acyl-CoA transferase
MPAEVHTDQQAIANGYLQEVDYGDGRSIALVAAPVQFDEEPHTLEVAPGLGSDTDAVLGELGLEWDRLVELKVAGVIS